MDPLLKSALIGTGKHAVLPGDTATPIEQLFTSRTTDSPEKSLLLRAGAAGIARIAGMRTQEVPVLPAAPREEQFTPRPRIATLLASALSLQSIALLPEFLQVLRSAQVAFPHQLLPDALDCQDAARRQQLREVLGERARWLANFNPAWHWIQDSALPDMEISRLQTVFEEGTFNERAAALRDLRRLDPAIGRQLLEPSLAFEKGDQRCRLLEQLREGLSQDDEQLLMAFQRDRSRKVRGIVCELLAKIIDSQLSQRMCARAASLLTASGNDCGQLQFKCELPIELPVDWEEDGIIRQPSAGIGPRSWWLTELLQRVPPSFWTRHFATPPQELLRGIRTDELAATIRTGWLKALIFFRATDPAAAGWRQPFWDALLQEHCTQIQYDPQLVEQLTALADVMSATELDESLMQWLRRAADVTHAPFETWASRLPAPWSAEFSELYLQVSRRLFQTRGDAPAARWCQTLLPAAIGLSPACFTKALEPWNVNADRQGVWQNAQLETWLQRFGEVIRIRQEFRQEVVQSIAGPLVAASI